MVVALVGCSRDRAEDNHGTDSDLKEMIEMQVPELRHISDPLRQAELILDWVAGTVDLGLTQSIAPNLESMPASQMMSDVWVPDIGGGLCAGWAVFNAKVLRLFGINSFTINFGMLEDGLTMAGFVVMRSTM